ncbi:hypothetical protein AWB69_05171 [Caballeronia udeis]|uniref:Uncharacterized protein n=1 Tax=Caballeronia udeis TaxID=1232866 RepID=A0A158I2J5_9BURK|nr:hypothetical protein [Caballeronia udeis]SAL50784.1 hypothetical protein AWB69_05171 [Caballeronia udeis]
MFAKFSKTLNEFFFLTEEQKRESYLGKSVDFVDLERRIHAFEMNHQPITLYSDSTSRDRHF